MTDEPVVTCRVCGLMVRDGEAGFDPEIDYHNWTPDLDWVIHVLCVPEACFRQASRLQEEMTATDVQGEGQGG